MDQLILFIQCTLERETEKNLFICLQTEKKNQTLNRIGKMFNEFNVRSSIDRRF